MEGVSFSRIGDRVRDEKRINFITLGVHGVEEKKELGVHRIQYKKKGKNTAQ